MDVLDRDDSTPERQKAIVRGVAVLAVVGLAARILVCFVLLPEWERQSGSPPYPDSYPDLARSLLERGTLGFGSDGAGPTTVRGPAFAAWLAVGMLVGGDDARWLGLWAGVPILILGPILAALLWRRYGPVPAIVGFAVAVCHPLPSMLVSRVMSEDFYAACGFGAAILWVAALRPGAERRRLALAALAGVLIAMQMLTRSTGVLTLAVLLAVGAVVAPRRPALLAVLATVALLPAIAWSVRSSRLEGRPVFVHSLFGYNFWVGEGFDRFGSGWTSPEAWSRTIGLVAEKAGSIRAPPGDFTTLGSPHPRSALSTGSLLERPAAGSSNIRRGISRGSCAACHGSGSKRSPPDGHSSTRSSRSRSYCWQGSALRRVASRQDAATCF